LNGATSRSFWISTTDFGVGSPFNLDMNLFSDIIEPFCYSINLALPNILELAMVGSINQTYLHQLAKTQYHVVGRFYVATVFEVLVQTN
jgi:hypothetical protein